MTQQVIDSLGGITDTVKPMEHSLRMNELRPFEYVPNYAYQLSQIRQGKFEELAEKQVTKIVSASPFRASLQVVDHGEVEQLLNRDGTQSNVEE